MSHSSSVPPKAATYFGIATRPPYAEHPTIEQVFRDTSGWARYPITKRVSLSAVRRLRKEGVSSIALRYGARVADFRIIELAS